MKKCPKCGRLLDDSNFYIQKTERKYGKLTSWCKQCSAEQAKQRYENNKDKCREEHRKWVENNKDKVAFNKAKSSYGITKEQYNSLKKIYRTVTISNSTIIKSIIIEI